MMISGFPIRLFHSLLVLGVLVGCGPQPNSDSSTSSNHVSLSAGSISPVSIEEDRVIVGHGSKGPMIGATVELFEIDEFGYPASDEALVTTHTDEFGNWQASLPASTPDLLVKVSGGRYIDESDTNVEQRRQIILSQDEFLLSMLPSNQQTVAVTVYTHALIEKSRRETGAANFTQVVAANLQLFNQAVGFNILQQLPADPLRPMGDDEQNAYAMMVGGAANAITSLAVAMGDAVGSYQHIKLVIEDLIDCQLDGKGIGSQSIVDDQIQNSTRLDLNEQILRFRNNNFMVYQDQPVVAVDEIACAQIGGLMDTLAPTLSVAGEISVINANSFEGLMVDPSIRTMAKQQFNITDDRVGPITLDVGLPAVLGLGSHVLHATARDSWGNTSQIQWQLTVDDLTPPSVDALPTVVVAAVGDRTPVSLEIPHATDNATPFEDLVILNNAPGDGFPVGQTAVTWTIQDQRGLTTTLIQLVQVNSVPPRALPVPSMLGLVDGLIDFSQFFDDPDGTSLTYAITGLPQGTGLSFNSSTGRLEGIPTVDDLAAQPINIMIMATDGQNQASIETALSIELPNRPPFFSLSNSVLELDEDFGVVSVSLIPDSVVPYEHDQIVTYTVEMMGALEPIAEFEIDSEAETLTITSVPQAFGELVLHITADDGATQNATFSRQLFVRIASVNDVPQIVGEPIVPVLNVGESFSLDMNHFVSDVDDEFLTFEGFNLPPGAAVTTDGTLTILAQPSDALVSAIPFQIASVDGDGASAVFELVYSAIDPDSDGDGISDYLEQQAGFDSLNADSDNDGFADSLEWIVDIDLANDVVVYVSANGNDSGDGLSVDTAVASIGALNTIIDSIQSDQRLIVLIEENEQPYVGQIRIENGQQRYVLGSLTFGVDAIALTTGGGDDRMTQVSADTGSALHIQNCQNCTVASVGFVDGAGMATVIDSSVSFDYVYAQRQYRTQNGAAMALSNSAVSISNSWFAGNVSRKKGGVLWAREESVVDIVHSVFSGNFAYESGGLFAIENSGLTVHNSLLVANGSNGAALVDSLASDAVFTNITMAHSRGGIDTPLVRCKQTQEDGQDDGQELPCETEQRVTITRSVLINNQALQGGIVELDADIVDAHDNLIESASDEVFNNIPVPLDSSFSVNYGLSEDLLVGVDASSVNAASIGLDGRYAVANASIPDNGLADLGYHQVDPLMAPSEIQVTSVYMSNSRHEFSRYPVEIRVFAGGAPLEGVHQVSVALEFTGLHANHSTSLSSGQSTGRSTSESISGQSRTAAVLSTGHVSIAEQGVPAVDLGAGRYLIWLSDNIRPGYEQLRIFVGDDTEGIVTVPQCSIDNCGELDITTEIAEIGHP